MTIPEEKKVLRKELLAKRLLLTEVEFTNLSNKINGSLIKNVDWESVNTLYIYSTIKRFNEIDTKQFIDFINQTYPDITIDVAENKISAGKNIPVNKSYDLVIVPLLGFDRRGYRLGYGGGYYDKFLAKNDCRQIIGLAYSLCGLAKIPDEPHDQKMNKIITEKEIITIAD